MDHLIIKNIIFKTFSLSEIFSHCFSSINSSISFAMQKRLIKPKFVALDGFTVLWEINLQLCKLKAKNSDA